jgi:hypothetical protein
VLNITTEEPAVHPRTLFHTTTAEKATSIMAGGFRDHATVNPRLTATYCYQPGVWFGDVPALDDEWFDGVRLFDFDAERQAFIAVTIPAIYLWPIEGVEASAIDRTWPGTQFWGKAAVWNQFPRRMMSLDEIIAHRLETASPEFVRSMRGWVRRDRGYAEVFAARVRKALDKITSHQATEGQAV